MTEEEWLTTNESRSSLQFLRWEHRATRSFSGRRRLRLFACGCCRQIWPLLIDSRLRSAVETAERFADGQATKTELEAAHATARQLGSGELTFDLPGRQDTYALEWVMVTTTGKAWNAVLHITSLPVPLSGVNGERIDTREVICDLLRDLFGNPFQPKAIESTWLTSAVVALAREMYEARDFSAMPILADALQDAGCEDIEVLEHCRAAKGLHIRGCWLLDQILRFSRVRCVR